MDKAWLDSVLADCVAFAKANDLPELEAACHRAARVAARELANRPRPDPGTETRED